MKAGLAAVKEKAAAAKLPKAAKVQPPAGPPPADPARGPELRAALLTRYAPPPPSAAEAHREAWQDW